MSGLTSSRPPNPLVSIITPSFNQADYLEQTIHSVLAQDYAPLEYLVVDGGSTDNSLAIIKKYADRLAWWISEPDGGQADAINKGFSRARGEIVAWLNSDDVYAPGAISRVVQVFQGNPQVGLVFGDAVTFDQHGRPLNDLVFGEMNLEALMAFKILCQPAIFIRQEMLAQAGPLDISYHYLLDHQLWIRLAMVAPIQHVPTILAYARHHPTAKNVAQAAGFGQEAYRIAEWMRSSSVLSPIFKRNHKRIWSGAHRFNARYLLDGGQPRDALKAYWQALRSHPPTVLVEWHRMLYALLSSLGGGILGRFYYQFRQMRLPASARAQGLTNIKQLYEKTS